MLLGADGTVTHILAAYADEPIDVVKLHQDHDVASRRDAALELPAGAEVLRRLVLLRARNTRRTLLFAEAVVAVDRVGPAFVEGLLGTDRPIGLLLAENRTETFREILVTDCEPAGALCSHFGIDATAELLTRTYRIVARQQPILLITEKFPSASFRSLPA